MTRHRLLHAGYERLIGSAIIDCDLRAALLRDPERTARTFGISAEDAALCADIYVSTMQQFAASLLPRLYETKVSYVPRRTAVAG